ncbi:hypothetical protein [Ralstonia phage RP31]|uniref:Uncharacterized protein n=2 Tax=Ripduovirus RP12 TaxID=2560700 RepID=A0A1L7N0S9_9CAUD|nr:hypothetical protein FDH28_gp091 [Ralstonia phage RP12]BAW19065.1 hypothetical protein [Ralstonia phage RP12]BAW19350.1 hypothetical protein [Ralstonia phage RP31]
MQHSHQTGMFTRGQQQQAPQVEIYDVNQIGVQFQNWNFQIGQPYDQATPQIALMTINEIQQQALRGHPLRVGMFEVISDNAFNNKSFEDLVYTIIMRMGYGVQAGEWRNLDIAANTTIARAVKCCGSAMAAEDPQFMASLPPQEQAAVRENAEIWNYLIALAQNQVAYVPFSQMGTGSGGGGFGTVSGSTQEALRDARALRGQGAGAFVESTGSEYGVTQSRYNNDAGQRHGRYGRRAEKIFGKVEGAMQDALKESGLVNTEGEPTHAMSSYQARMRRPNPTASQPPVDEAARSAAAKFDSDVTDFSKPLETTVTEAPAPVEQKPLFSVQMGDEVVDVIRERKDGAEAWKPSRLQRFHPAWCKRTHTVRYFETKQDSLIIAVLQELTQEQKEIAMNYEAHAIDPTKGQPDPAVPQRPVSEKAKVLYAPADKVTVNVIIADKFCAEEDVDSSIRTTRLTAEMSESVPDAYARRSQVNSAVVYASADDAAEDAIVIKAISSSKDFAEAASYIGKIRDPLARKLVNDLLTQAVNRATDCEMGVGIRISDFSEDGPAIVAAVEQHYGALFAEKLRATQTAILQNNVHVVPATDPTAVHHAQAVLISEGNEELSDAVLARVLFLQRNICAVWVNYTDNELAIGVPTKGAAVIQADSLGALHQIARSTFEKAIGNQPNSEQFLITKDNVRYRLHQGMLNKDCFLLSKEAKAA